MLVAGARYCEHGILHTRWKTGFRVEHLGRLQGAKDAATIGSTRFGPIHDWRGISIAISVVSVLFRAWRYPPGRLSPRSRCSTIVSSTMPWAVFQSVHLDDLV